MKKRIILTIIITMILVILPAFLVTVKDLPTPISVNQKVFTL